MLRPVRESRLIQPSRQYRNDFPVNTDILGDHANDLLKRLYVPMIRERSTNAVNTEPKLFYLYQKLESGRRCSCFIGTTSPSGKCPICHQQGIVGGFLKFGTNQITVDTTAPNVELVNIHPNYEQATRPAFFVLDNGAVTGHIQTRIQMYGVRNHLDIFQVVATKTSATRQITTYIKTPTETTFVLATTENVEARLTSTFLDFRVIFSRFNVNEDSPMLSHIFLRYAMMEDLKIKGDIDRNEESRVFGELGFFEQSSMINIFFDSTVARFTNDDFLFRVDKGNRWKMVATKANEPAQILTSWDCTVRIVHSFESYSSVPI